MEHIPTQNNNEMKESLETTPEEIIFDELQKVARSNFAEGGKYYEDAQALTVFIAEGRSKINEFLAEARARDTASMNDKELVEYDKKQSVILDKFNYLFLYPHTEREFNQITEASF